MLRTRRILPCSLLGLLILGPGMAPQQAADGITADEILAHIDYLTSDELAGRDAGQPGAELAATYFQEELESYGYGPLGESWEMAFPVLGGAKFAAATLTLEGETVDDPVLVQVPNYSGVGTIRDTLAAGDPVDLAGRLALLTGAAGRPEAAGALERGAAGVVLLRDEDELAPVRAGRIIFNPPIDFFDLPEDVSEDMRTLIEDQKRLSGPVVLVSGKLRERVLAAARSGRAITLTVTRQGQDGSANVIGVLEGSDPELRDEYVLIGGHYDHLGVDEDGRIYRGADDNASGTAGVLEIAEALASLDQDPRRSILVVGWGAEEEGLTGSFFFCKNPPVDLSRVVTCLNLDMISRNDPDMVEILSASDDLRRLALVAAGRQGLHETPVEPGILTNSDSGPFVARGVPTVFFTSGMHGDHHRTTDTLEHVSADKAERLARAAFEVALGVANADTRPAFTDPGY